MRAFYSNIDIIIFIAFLATNLIIGFLNIKGIKNIHEYAIGRRNFSTGTIVATLIATWVGSSTLLADSSRVYTNGLFYLIPSIIGSVVSWLLISYFLSSKMERFLGSISTAQVMGNIYGLKIQFITAISTILLCIGRIAMQFHVASLILELFFNISGFYINLVVATIIIGYSAFGGIKSVSFTETVQFFTYSAIIPIMGLVAWNTFSDPVITVNSVLQNSLFNFKELADYGSSRFWVSITIFIYFSIPQLGPSIFQRILMAKDRHQISQSFSIAAFTCLGLSGLFIWIVMLLLSKDLSNDSVQNLFSNILEGYTGFKGLVAGGIIAMIISSTNSYLNVASVTASHDLLRLFNINIHKRFLTFSYISAILIGVAAFVLSFYTKNLINLFLIVASFYSPIITPSLIFLILGFHSSEKSVLIGIVGALLTILTWYIFSLRELTGIYGILPSMLVNIIGFMGSHYLLRQPGGFTLPRKKYKYKDIFFKLYNPLTKINYTKFYLDILPKNEMTYIYVGIFIIASIFSSLYTIPEGKIRDHIEIYNFIYHTVLIVSTIFITYPLWPATFKKQNIILFFWFIGMFGILIFFGSLLVITSNFYKLQLMAFMINLIIVATLLRWHVTLGMTIVGMFASAEFYKYFMGEKLLINEDNLQFRIIYLLTLFSALLIIFIKPKQEQHELVKEQNTHLGDQVTHREEELQKLLDLKYEFLRNINHEIHTPLTGIISLGSTLWEKYDQLNESQRQKSVEIIAKSSNKLKSLMSNILDLSKLSSLSYDLNKENLNLSELLEERIKLCKKLYLNNNKLNFIVNIENNIIFKCDEHYIKHTFDNLIINAITYGNEGNVTIDLKKTIDGIKFSIKDEGIGVPLEELDAIFGLFVVSSKTRSPAGGRGVGLALCKKVIEVHGGEIWAENDLNNKTTFIFILH